MKIRDQRKKLHKYIVCGILASVISVMGSCGSPGSTRQQESNPGGGTKTVDASRQPGLEEKESYGALLASHGVALPASRPSIYVDVAGYVSGREKKVIFAGENHGQTFDVVRSRDNEVVYTGIIPRGEEDRLSG